MFRHTYKVDLDDPKMVAQAREYLYEDLIDATQHGKNSKMIIEVEDKSATDEELGKFVQEGI